MSSSQVKDAQFTKGKIRRALDLGATVLMLAASVTVMLLAWRSYNQPVSAARPSAPLPTSPVSIAGAELRGREDAPVVLLIFSDFQCPFCRIFATNTFGHLVDQYVNTGKLQVAFRNFPIKVHPLAEAEARMAVCAGKEGKFWQMHDRLFVNPKITSEELQNLPSAIGADTVGTQACFNSEAVRAAVQADIASAHELKFQGTPGFFVGTRYGKDEIIARKRLAGAMPLQAFQQAIDQALAKTSPAK